MTLRGPRANQRWSPTADDPLRGCAEGTRRLHALIVAEPGIGQSLAATRAGVGDVPTAVGTLVGRGLVEVRQDSRFHNYLWPVPR